MSVTLYRHATASMLLGEDWGDFCGGVLVPQGSRSRHCRFGWWVREPGDIWRLLRFR